MASSDAFYIDLKNEVDIVLADFGTLYYTRGQSTYDPDTMQSTPAVTKTVSGLVANQQQVSGTIGDVGNTWVATKTLILSASSDIESGEEVQVDGRWFSLAKLEPIKPADIVVVYLLDIS